jgi:septal ring factor EnvC (AmiA/AmiB activator)
MYDSPRDTAAQLEKFLLVLATHQQQLEAQMKDLQANLDELKVHQREAKALLAKSQRQKATP